VDKKRVHFDGYSMGGWMTWRFICAHADIIASAAPIAAGSGGASCEFSDAQKPVRELPIFYTHGTTDGLVSFNTATTMRDAIISAWGLRQKDVVAEGADYKWLRYDNAKGTIFEFAQHDWQTPSCSGARRSRATVSPATTVSSAAARTPLSTGEKRCSISSSGTRCREAWFAQFQVRLPSFDRHVTLWRPELVPPVYHSQRRVC
jgi:dienelactone hydrolase